MFYSALDLTETGGVPPTGIAKTSSFKGLKAEQSFDLAGKMLDKERFAVQQVRRVDKLAGTDVKSVVLNY